MEKPYLSDQIQLITLTTYDLMTPAEAAIASKIAKLNYELPQKSGREHAKERKTMDAQRRDLIKQLNALIKKYPDDKPRYVLTRIVNKQEYADLSYVTWDTLKFSRKIAEFTSEESRAMGLHKDYLTYDKVIIKWKSIDMLRQIVLNGFVMRVMIDGEIIDKHYRFITASAGQLRTDKIQCMSDEEWSRIENRMTCGLTWEKINAQGGVNVNKYLAYLALPSSATLDWDIDLDRIIVVKDFIAPVTDIMDFITPEYKVERGVRTVDINHGDGCGMMLPKVSKLNKMIRGPWIKGLLSTFDFIRFCKVNGVKPELEDIWHTKHDLIKEDIQIILTESQFKMASYYSSWDEYKTYFRKYGCRMCHTNFEEEYISDSEINYQMLQTLQTPTDEELRAFTQKAYDRIRNVGSDKTTILNVLEADPLSMHADKVAVSIYHPLLRDEYYRATLRDIRRRMILDARSGRIRCANKRLYVLPDLYAMCQYLFLGDEHPTGLLQNGQVAARLFRDAGKVDCLRSPHLYMEHAVRNVVNNPNVYRWFTTNAIYVSVHDMISRILQFDCDGDQLNVVSDKYIVEWASREIRQFDVVPLFYDAQKAPKEMLTQEAFFHGLERAHEFSFIGMVSNALSRLWNRPNPDMTAAKFLCYYNNQVIDAAKTGKINSYKSYPDVMQRINQATGGDSGRMPYFFQFSKNGRHNNSRGTKVKTKKRSLSTMDRICDIFEHVGVIHFNYDEVPMFNWKMLIGTNDVPKNQALVDEFFRLDDENFKTLNRQNDTEKVDQRSFKQQQEELQELVINKLTSQFGPLETIYPTIVEALFSGDNIKRSTHKNAFWQIFGDIAVEHLRRNMHSPKSCPVCLARLPKFDVDHTCANHPTGVFKCPDCGEYVVRHNARQVRCPDCQAKYRIQYQALKYQQRKAG